MTYDYSAPAFAKPGIPQPTGQSSAARVSRVESSLDETDLAALTEGAMAAILDGGALDWHQPPERRVLERYFTGMVQVPGRELFIVRQDDGTIGGAAVLTLPGRSGLHIPSAALTTGFIAPYARRQGLGTLLVEAIIDHARNKGTRVINCEVREIERPAIQLLEKLGFLHWGTHPFYARSGGQTVRGLYFTKLLEPEGERSFHTAAASGPAPSMLLKSSSHKTGSSKTAPCETVQVTNAQAAARPLSLYPAIDLKDGACVRLRQGEMSNATQYSDNPAAQARAFEDAGCRHLHVVDLDGAFAGQSANVAAVEAILKETSLPVQLGGGLRDMRGIERWLEAGVSRVILGSVAVKDPGLVRQAARAWPGRVVAGIDARNGRVATEGWAEVSELTAPELALRMEDAGVSAVIFTEITRDGMLEGLDLDQTADLASRISIPVIASGGVGTVAHLQALRQTSCRVPGISGVVVGRALYDGRVSLAEALKVLAAPC